MNWRRIPKEKSKQPTSGSYKDWKELLAKEGFNQCVYCSIHEARFGGIRNFHVEHFRPKSKFKGLTNDINNLFYACAICNVFKSNDWHENDDELNFDRIFYPDPSKVDYKDLFKVGDNGFLKGNYLASKFLVEKLALNRPQLILDRYQCKIIHAMNSHLKQIRVMRDELVQLGFEGNKEAQYYLKKLINFHDDIVDLRLKINNSSPYRTKDTQKDG